MNTASLIFKIADETWEYEEINRLNYETFVEEIPQHEHNNERKLQDKFDSENIYIICLLGTKLIGMVALRMSCVGNLEQLDRRAPAS